MTGSAISLGVDGVPKAGQDPLLSLGRISPLRRNSLLHQGAHLHEEANLHHEHQLHQEALLHKGTGSQKTTTLIAVDIIVT